MPVLQKKTTLGQVFPISDVAKKYRDLLSNKLGFILVIGAFFGLVMLENKYILLGAFLLAIFPFIFGLLKNLLINLLVKKMKEEYLPVITFNEKQNEE